MLLASPVLISLLLLGCHSPEVSDAKINDRVKACSAGFSEGLQASLHASANKAALSGEFGGEFHEETKSLIISELPESDKLKGYEDYIKCVQTKWNK